MLQLAGNNIIQILDIDVQEPWRGPIETLFEKYSNQVRYCEPIASEVDPTIAVFRPHNMHITDWTGWSKIDIIHKRQLSDKAINKQNWIKLSVQNSSVICTTNSTVLEWQDTGFKRAFQGRPIWFYECLTLNELRVNSEGRVLNLSDNPKETFFGNYIIEPIEYDRMVYYEIFTHSRFYNVNKILDASVGHRHTGWK